MGHPVNPKWIKNVCGTPCCCEDIKVWRESLTLTKPRLEFSRLSVSESDHMVALAAPYARIMWKFGKLISLSFRLKVAFFSDRKMFYFWIWSFVNNLVFATNSDFVIPISLQPNDVYLIYVNTIRVIELCTFRIQSLQKVVFEYKDIGCQSRWFIHRPYCL